MGNYPHTCRSFDTWTCKHFLYCHFFFFYRRILFVVIVNIPCQSTVWNKSLIAHSFSKKIFFSVVDVALWNIICFLTTYIYTFYLYHEISVVRVCDISYFQIHLMYITKLFVTYFLHIICWVFRLISCVVQGIKMWGNFTVYENIRKRLYRILFSISGSLIVFRKQRPSADKQRWHVSAIPYFLITFHSQWDNMTRWVEEYEKNTINGRGQ